MSQGSGGSPVNFLDPATCEAILDGLWDADERMPAFAVSPPGTPPPLLLLEMTTRDGHTQTGVSYSREKATNTFIDVTDAATQVVSRPHLWTSATQTATLVASTHDQTTQAHLRPRRSEAFSQTARPGTYHRVTQTDRPAPTIDSGTAMAPVLVATTGCQAGAYYSNDVILPGVILPGVPLSASALGLHICPIRGPPPRVPYRAPGGLCNLRGAAGSASTGLPVRVVGGGRRVTWREADASWSWWITFTS